jgi:hypothetical protein
MKCGLCGADFGDPCPSCGRYPEHWCLTLSTGGVYPTPPMTIEYATGGGGS